MQGNLRWGSDMMGGYGILPIVGLLLMVLLVLAIVRVSNKK